MKLVPDYNEQHKCFYCGENEANPKSGFVYNLFSITRTKLMSYSYVNVKVEVPRCKKCNRRHSWAAIPMLIAFIVILVIFIIKGLIPQWGSNSIWMNLFLLFVAIFLSLFGGVIVGILPNKIIQSLMKVKFDDDVEDYSPIKKLLNIGFRKDKPKAHTHPDALFNKELFNKTINEIIQSDKCKFVE